MKSLSSNFPLSYKILFFYVFLKTYQITILPFRDILKTVEFYLDVVFLSFFFILTLDFRNKYESINMRNNLINFILFFIFIVFLISSFYININYNLELRSILKLTTYILIYCAFFFNFAEYVYRNENLFDKLVDYTLYASVFLTVVGLLVNFIGINANPIIAQAYRGIFMHPNTFAFLFTICIPCLLYKFYTSQLKFIKFIVLFILFLFALFLTYSRSGYMAVLLSIFVFVFFRSRLLSIFILVLFMLIVYSFFTEIQGLKTDSTLARGILYITAYNLITENMTSLLWGYGVERATVLFTDSKMLFGNFETAVNNPHNFLLLLSLQFGVIFAFLYFSLIISILVKSAFKIKFVFENKFKWKIITCISVVSGLLIQNFFEELMIIPEFPVMPISVFLLGYLFYFISEKDSLKLKY